jgi:hypothetical protein
LGTDGVRCSCGYARVRGRDARVTGWGADNAQHPTLNTERSRGREGVGFVAGAGEIGVGCVEVGEGEGGVGFYGEVVVGGVGEEVFGGVEVVVGEVEDGGVF